MKFRRFAVWCLVLFTWPALAKQTQFTRFWVVEKNGATSYLLGTDHYLRVTDDDIPDFVTKAIKGSKAVYLEKNPGAPDVHPNEMELKESYYPATRYLRKIIWPEALPALKRIVPNRDLDRVLSMKPGPALLEILQYANDLKKEYLDEFSRLVDSHRDHLESLDFVPYQMPETLREFLEENFGTRDPVPALAKYIAEGEKSSSLDELLYEEAKKLRKPVVGLERFEPVSDYGAYLKLVGGDDLSRALLALDSRLQSRLGEIYFFEEIYREGIGRFWTREHYFNSTDDIGYVQMIRRLQDSPYHFPTLPGLHEINRYHYNTHIYWYKALHQKFEEGGAFVAVGLAHLAGDPTYAQKGMIDMLKDGGFKVRRYSPSCEERL